MTAMSTSPSMIAFMNRYYCILLKMLKRRTRANLVGKQELLLLITGQQLHPPKVNLVKILHLIVQTLAGHPLSQSLRCLKEPKQPPPPPAPPPPPPPPPSAPATVKEDWNTRFQRALELPVATPKLEALRAQAIQDCCRDFRDEVKTADIIIK